MANYGLVSADSHVVEPMEMWANYIDPAYRARAPRLTTEGDADYIQFEGLRSSRPASSPPPARTRSSAQRPVAWTRG